MSKTSLETKMKKQSQTGVGDTYAKHAGDEWSHQKASRRLRLAQKRLDRRREDYEDE